MYLKVAPFLGVTEVEFSSVKRDQRLCGKCRNYTQFCEVTGNSRKENTDWSLRNTARLIWSRGTDGSRYPRLDPKLGSAATPSKRDRTGRTSIVQKKKKEIIKKTELRTLSKNNRTRALITRPRVCCPVAFPHKNEPLEHRRWTWTPSTAV